LALREVAFADLVNRSTNFALFTLKEAEDEVIEALQTSGATRHVKNLQMIQLHRAVIAVGIFSLFESIVQDRLECRDGFAAVRECLERVGEVGLSKRFSLFVYAINILKHGRGRSYDELIAMSADLPFRIKRPGEDFFSEGDVSEVATLIEVDDRFVRDCAGLIAQVASVINKACSVWI
jgi:hypothetical protein